MGTREKKAAEMVRFLRDYAFRNLMKNYLPFPIDRKLCSAWAEGVPEGGETVIYTSMMYQMAPLFRNYEKILPSIMKLKGAARFAGLGKHIYKPSREETSRSTRILRNIASALSSSGVVFGYLHEEEPYSGALLLELGLLDEFHKYGEKLSSFFEERGIKRLITVDPHTTNALVRMSSKLASFPEVASYISLLKNASGSGEYVLHDSCLYSKHLGMYENIRRLMTSAGIELREDRMVTGRETSMCCGSPVGSVSPDLSERIASFRSSRLSSVGERVMVMCPMCYQNLRPHLNDIFDFAEVIK